MFVKCKTAEQNNKALKLQTLCKKEIMDRKVVGERRGCRGVISGIPVGENLEELRKLIKGGEVTGIKRLQAVRNGEKVDSPSVLPEFQGNNLPERVMLGYMSFSVRVYVPPPLRCYKCQRFGHIASVCKGVRCGRCRGEHVYDECASVATVGDHMQQRMVGAQ